MEREEKFKRKMELKRKELEAVLSFSFWAPTRRSSGLTGLPQTAASIALGSEKEPSIPLLFAWLG